MSDHSKALAIAEKWLASEGILFCASETCSVTKACPECQRIIESLASLISECSTGPSADLLEAMRAIEHGLHNDKGNYFKLRAYLDKHGRYHGNLQELAVMLEVATVAIREAERGAISECSQWIPCGERLPAEQERVLIWWRDNTPSGLEYYARFGEISLGHWRPEGGNGNFDDRVSHWMPDFAAPVECSTVQGEKK